MLIGEKRGRLEGGSATDEVIESSKSVLSLNRSGRSVGLQQYYTPLEVSRFIANVCGPDLHVFDPTAGDGALMAGFRAESRLCKGEEVRRYGCEIDADQVKSAKAQKREYHAVRGDLQVVFPLLQQVDVRFPCVVANPPFGLSWEFPTEKGDSTLLGFKAARGLLAEDGVGALIAGRDRFFREIHQTAIDAWFAIVEVERMFASTKFPCVIAFWREEGAWRRDAVDALRLQVAGIEDLDGLVGRVRDSNKHVFHFDVLSRAENLENKLHAVQLEYDARLAGRRPGQVHTVELKSGRLSVRPSAFAAIALAAKREYNWVSSFDKQPPSYFALQTKEWKKLLGLGDCGVTISPDAKKAIEGSLAEVDRIAVPLYQVAPAQRLGFLVDADSIRCRKSDPERGYEEGKTYPIVCGTQVLKTKEEREKQTMEGPTVVNVIVEKKAMEMTIGEPISGKYNEKTKQREPSPHTFTEGASDLEYVLDHFEVPEPGEIATRYPREIAYWEGMVARVQDEIREREPTFTFRTFQVRDVARLLFKGGGINAAEQGLGKTVMAIAFVRALEIAGRLPDGCALFVMPQDLVLQWRTELRRFLGRELVLVTSLGSDAAHPRKKRFPGEASALEVREMVRARRADLKALRAGVHLAPRPPVWVATWFEALATTGRLEEEMPVENVMRKMTHHEGRPATEYYDARTWSWQTTSVRPARTEIEQVTSEAQCPVCRAQRMTKYDKIGWNGSRCTALLKNPTPRRRVCGYVHRKILRKPAYSVLADLFKVVMVDEGTKIKGDDSYTSKSVRAIRAKYRVLSSGTPLRNFVTDLFWLLWWALGDSTARFPYSYKGGKDRFTDDFAVVETRLNSLGQKEGQAKVLPEVSNLLRLWKMLCSSLVRRRMDEVGTVVELDGEWKCPDCRIVHRADVNGPDGWTKPPKLECDTCGHVCDAIVPIHYVPVEVPWGAAQKTFYANWLDKRKFAAHFVNKHPDSPLVEKGLVELLAASIGQLAKLEYACTDPAGDPDEDYKRWCPRCNSAAKIDANLVCSGCGMETPALSSWTPGRLKILQLAAQHVSKGDKVLIGSSLVAPGPWICDRLCEREIRAVHICEEGADGKMATKAPKKRASAVAEFREGAAQVLCVGVNAMCLGHNLDVASVVIIDGLPWDFATHDQFIKRARRLTSKKSVTVYVILPENSLSGRKWSGLKDKTASSDLALDGKLSHQDEKPIDRAAVLRELQRKGARIDGTEVLETEIARMWQEWEIGEQAIVEPPVVLTAPTVTPIERRRGVQMSFFGSLGN